MEEQHEAKGQSILAEADAMVQSTEVIKDPVALM